MFEIAEQAATAPAGRPGSGPGPVPAPDAGVRHAPDPGFDPLARMDAAHAAAGAAHLRMLRLIPELERTQAHRAEGARDTCHLLQMRYGVSAYRARRMVEASRALPQLPHLAFALSSGVLGLDKVLELARFATPRTEEGLVGWARRVSLRTIWRRAQLAERLGREQAAADLAARRCSWWYSPDGRLLHLEADLPAADGARLVAAIRSLARRVPVLPGQEGPGSEAARRADALVALCTRGGGASATVVIHAGLGAISSEAAGAGAQDGAVIHPASARRLSCTGVVENLHEDHLGRLLHRHRDRRRPPAWIKRQVRWRDGGCTFPGCGTMAFTEAHHIRWVRFGGATTLENLALVCSFHHRLVHEYGWGMRRLPTGELVWYRPDGRRYEPEPPRAGPDPP